MVNSTEIHNAIDDFKVAVKGGNESEISKAWHALLAEIEKSQQAVWNSAQNP